MDQCFGFSRVGIFRSELRELGADAGMGRDVNIKGERRARPLSFATVHQKLRMGSFDMNGSNSQVLKKGID